MTDNPYVAKRPFTPPGVSSFAAANDPGSNLVQIIDQIEMLLTGATRLPWTNRVLVDRLDLLDLVDRMRVALPDELQDARDLLMERDELLSRAQSDVERATSQARQQIEVGVDQSDLVDAARARARGLLADAEREAAETQHEANAYALEVLQRLEDELAGNLNTVRGGIRALREDLQLSEAGLPSQGDS